MHNSTESSRLYSRSSKKRNYKPRIQGDKPALDVSPNTGNSFAPTDDMIGPLATMGGAAGFASLPGQRPSPAHQLSTPSSVELQDSSLSSSDPGSSTTPFPYTHEPVPDPVLEYSHNTSTHSPVIWNDLIFLDELNKTFGPLNPSTDTHVQLDLLLNSVRGTPAIMEDPAEVLNNHLDVQRIEQELLRTPALQQAPLYEARGGPPLPPRLKMRLDESIWSTYVTQLKAASKVSISSRVLLGCLFQNPSDFVPLPRVSALDRYINAYLSGLCQHIPFIHLPTFDVNALELPRLLAICSIGALYCFEKGQARCLYLMAVRLIYQVWQTIP